MNGRHDTFVPGCILLLLVSTATVACPVDCGECGQYDGYDCVPVGTCDMDASCPGDCCNCVGCNCEDDWSQCGDCSYCEDCECWPVELDLFCYGTATCAYCDKTFWVSACPWWYAYAVEWSAPGGTPSEGIGATFTTYWSTSGSKTVIASVCDDEESQSVTVNAWWRPGPNPTGSIRCSNGQRWDHMNDACDSIPLEIEDAVDHDDRCGCTDGRYETQTTNHIDIPSTQWVWDTDEGYCSPPTGASTCWYATSTGQPTWVKAKLRDYSTYPDASANDADVWTESYTDLHGFKVGVCATFNGAWNGSSGNTWEGQSYSGPDGAEAVWIQTSRIGQAGTDAKSNYFYAQFTGVVEPSDALPPGRTKVDLVAGLSATWSGITSDCDAWDEAGDRVTIGFAVGGGGIGGSFSYGWSLADSEEGIASLDWAYTTDSGLGGQRIPAPPPPPNSPPLLTYESGDNPDIPPTVGQFTHGEALLRNVPEKRLQKGEVTRGQYDIWAASQSTGHCIQDGATCNCRLEAPLISMHNIEYEP